MRWLRNIAVVIAFLATTAPMAHVLEMPSKLTLDGPLWLAVQQHLYRGWGAVFGPIEILALVCALALLLRAQTPRERQTYLVATACYIAMLLCFFVFNTAVNQALNGWTANTLPPDWPSYRLRWEIGHALAALFALIAFAILLRDDTPAMPASAPAEG